MLGRAHRFTIGKHSGIASIAACLSELGLPVAPTELPAILARVRERAVADKRWVNAEALRAIWSEVRRDRLIHDEAAP